MPTKKKPEPRLYYDIFDIMKWVGCDNIDDIIDCDQITSNGCMIGLYPDNIEYEKDEKKRERLQKIYDEFGEIQVKVWW